MNSSSWNEIFTNTQPFHGPSTPLDSTPAHLDSELQSPLSDPAANLLGNVPLYEPILSPAVHKDTSKYFGEDVFNGACKDSQSFLQCSSGSRNEGSFPISTHNYSGSSIGFNPSTIDQKPIDLNLPSIDQKPIIFTPSPSTSFNTSPSVLGPPSPSPFGVLPHEEQAAAKRSKENFVSPVSKTANAYSPVSKTTVLPYSNGPYAATENNGVAHNPLSNSSSFSNETASPSPAAINSLSSNFSSPSNDYTTFSPQQNLGAYQCNSIKSVHSPMPQSPSVAHHSYPSSPYTNLDSVGHISAPPPCSPMTNGGTYVNSLKAVPNTIRNGLHKQLQCTNTSAISNNVCFTPQSHMGPIPGLAKTPDYHHDFNMCPPDRVSPASFSSGYTSMPSSRSVNDSRMSLSPRGNPSIPHEAQMRYGHLRSVPSATATSPSYLPGNLSATATSPSYLPGNPSATAISPTYLASNVGGNDVQCPPQKMKPPSYMPSLPSISTSNTTCYGGQSRIPNKVTPEVDPYAYNSPDEDEKDGLKLLDCEISRRPSSSTSYSKHSDKSISYLNRTPCPLSAMMRSSNPTDSQSNRPVQYHSANYLVQPPVHIKKEQMSSEHHQSFINDFGLLDHGLNSNALPDPPKKRGRRRGGRAGGNVSYAVGRGRGRGSRGGSRGARGGGRGRSKSTEDKAVYFSYPSSRIENNTCKRVHIKDDPDYVPIANFYDQQNHVTIESCTTPFNICDVPITDSSSMKKAPSSDGMALVKLELCHYNNVVVTVRPKRNLRSCAKERNCSSFMLQFGLFCQERDNPPPGTVFPSKEEPEPEEEPVPEPEEEPVMPKLTAEAQEPSRKKRKRNSQEPERAKGSLKMKFKILDDNKWCIVRGEGTHDSPLTLQSEDEEPDEEVSSFSNQIEMLPSHKIKIEILSDDESEENPVAKETGNYLSKPNSVSTNRTNFKTLSREQSPNSVTNSENFSVGKGKIKKDQKPASPANNQENDPSEEMADNNDKSPHPDEKEIEKQEMENSAENGQDQSLPEIPPEEMGRKDRAAKSRKAKEPKPGPSNEPNSAEENLSQFDCEDSDSDPAWTPDKGKKGESSKPFAILRARGRGVPKAAKAGASRRASTPKGSGSKGNGVKGSGKKRRRSPSPPSSPSSTTSPAERKPRKRPQPRKKAEGATKGKKESSSHDRFLIAKADIEKPAPFIWKVDRKSSMLQRYEQAERNGVILYHSSFTYAAGNQFCVNNYVEAKVKVLTPDTVQYLGPILTETAEDALSGMKQVKKEEPKKEEKPQKEEKPKKEEKPEKKFEYLKEDFVVYLQCLLSQDMDKNFLREIMTIFKDDYFTVPINTMETLTENKKDKFFNELWNEDIKKSIHTLPQHNILESSIIDIKCQACNRTQSSKLLQFFGQAYDPATLRQLPSTPSVTTQFSVCDNCSTSISLYCRLQHHRYNLFRECHSKASQVKDNNSDLKRAEHILSKILEDTKWVDRLFAESVKLWLEVKKEQDDS